MAKALTKANLALLAIVVAATVHGGDKPFHMDTLANLQPLIDNDVVEVNDEIKDGDKIAARATEKGIELSPPVNPEGNNNTVNTATTAAPAAANKLEIISVEGAVFGASRTRRASSVYDFDAMAVGQFIFVPNSEDKPNAAQSLASTVSSANTRFSTDTGEKKIVKVKDYQLGEDGKRAKGPDGKLILIGEHEEERPVLTPGKTFAVKPVEGGKAYGSWTAPADGAVILREA